VNITVDDTRHGLSFSYFASPEFGVEFAIEEQQTNQPSTRLESQVDDIEILQSREHTDSYAVGYRSINIELVRMYIAFSRHI
jgi:hypothetical protein